MVEMQRPLIPNGQSCIEDFSPITRECGVDNRSGGRGRDSDRANVREGIVGECAVCYRERSPNTISKKPELLQSPIAPTKLDRLWSKVLFVMKAVPP